MKTICIMCPMGCSLDINRVGEEVIVKGNHCKRGEIYGRQEFIAPKRIVTSLIKLEGGGVVSVKTSDLIDKSKIFDILNAIKDIKLKSPVMVGDIVVENILDTGVDIITTREG